MKRRYTVQVKVEALLVYEIERDDEGLSKIDAEYEACLDAEELAAQENLEGGFSVTSVEYSDILSSEEIETCVSPRI